MDSGFQRMEANHDAMVQLELPDRDVPVEMYTSDAFPIEVRINEASTFLQLPGDETPQDIIGRYVGT